MRVRKAFRAYCIVWLLLTVLTGSARAADTPIAGHIVDPSGLPLPGVTITLTSSSTAPLSVTTGADGRFAVDLPAGSYVFVAELQGFERATRSLTVGDTSVSLDITLQLARLASEVSVTVPEPAIIGESRPVAPSIVPREILENAVVPSGSVLNVLALLPNVVRGPDGLISVAGARAPQGQLLVNGLTQNDPVVGTSALMVPLDPVDSVQVSSRGYSAEFGRATGGVTQIAMRVPTDLFRFTVNSLDPRLHFADGGIRGIEAWEPNFGMSGPLVKGRIWFAQGTDYRWERFSFDTNAGIEESRYQAALSWNAIDATLTPNHRLSVWVSTDPQTTHHAGITAFTPGSTLPQLHNGGWRAATIDRVVLSESSTIETAVQMGALRTEVTPSGVLPYVLAHDLYRGNYFNTQKRTARRFEVISQWSRSTSTAGGSHLFKAGGQFSAMEFDGINSSLPVEQVRSDGSLARTIGFLGSASLSQSGREMALFAQDTWAVNPDLTLDLGVRYDRATIAQAAIAAPRIAAAWKIDPALTLVGGFGQYSDKVLLAAAAFPLLQARTVTEFDANGLRSRGPRTYLNRLDGDIRMPSANAWHLQLDRRAANGFIYRVGYQEQHTRQEPTIDVVDTPGAEALVLRSAGTSRSRSVEATIGQQSTVNGSSIYLSYVRASAIGNLNDFVSLEGSVKEAYVQPDETGPLAADVPHRFLAWGLFKLPSRVTVAPFLELRSGFPFAAIDDEWRFAGARNSQRFPVFASLDLSVNKIVKLPGSLPLAKVGLKLYNITGSNNARDVQRDILRRDFGTLYNPLRRQIRGVFEILWGKTR